MRKFIVLAPLLLLLLGQTASQPAPVNPELERLRRENTELKKQIETLRTENDRLRKQWAQALREGTGGLSTPLPPASTSAASQPAAPKLSQDGPGLYRATSGRFTTEFRAKSREEAIDKALKTVGKKSMDFDENVEIGTLRVEKIAN